MEGRGKRKRWKGGRREGEGRKEARKERRRQYSVLMAEMFPIRIKHQYLHTRSQENLLYDKLKKKLHFRYITRKTKEHPKQMGKSYNQTM